MVSRIAGFFRRNDMDPDCTEARESSSDFLDEDLDESMASRISEHLGRCGPCNSFIQTMKATVALLRATPQEKAPPNFAERLKKRIEED
ncbi:MAG: hypothetical protein BZY79_04250 [SAR202 cluster bacterium Casp-Chloro-G4]|nr:zf-HC2 domain-containing protein [Chloroflexota bacterium]MDA1228306.1 zf-HC2 domain-containing protein [Chloroflexota bacterium]PKB61406.1 MAG: hypothetical protein BZY79_04250 [SAR202 cluster bacterium Casp-Chloro-G4]